MNKRCVALTDEQYRESISLLRSGFILDEKLIKPNERIAAVEVLQATLGLRLGDTLKLKMCSFIKDGSRYRLDIKEGCSFMDFIINLTRYMDNYDVDDIDFKLEGATYDNLGLDTVVYFPNIGG